MEKKLVQRKSILVFVTLLLLGSNLIYDRVFADSSDAFKTLRKIAFTARPEGIDHIFLINSDGSGLMQLTHGAYPDNYLQWSPDGTKIAFERSENGIAIYTMNADGSNVVRLSPPASHDTKPSWSPDGSKIVFTWIVEPPPLGELPKAEIRVMNADGSNVKTILSNNSFNMEPRWSPDGSKILFMSNQDGDGVQLYTIDIITKRLKKLTNIGNNGDPAWFPDGSRISFGSDREGDGKVNIYTMLADGSDVKQLTHFLPPYEAGDTDPSPDGKQIVFEWDKAGNRQSDPNAYAEIWIMNADGTGQRSLQQPCSAVGCSPRWQPKIIAR